jgi:hypothetical protein
MFTLLGDDMAMDLEAPGIPIYWGTGEMVEYEPTYDAATVAMRDSLNAVTYYQPTMPPAFQTWVRTYGPTNDESVNVGFHQADVNPIIQPTLYRYEAPDVPVRHLPYQELLFNSTLVQETVAGNVIFNALRSPTPNEGIF